MTPRRVTLEATLFGPLAEADARALDAVGRRLGRFLGSRPNWRFDPPHVAELRRGREPVTAHHGGDRREVGRATGGRVDDRCDIAEVEVEEEWSRKLGAEKFGRFRELLAALGG